jgi:hypothetical protein
MKNKKKTELSFFSRLPQCSELPRQEMTIAEQVKKFPVHYENRCVFSWAGLQMRYAGFTFFFFFCNNALIRGYWGVA